MKQIPITLFIKEQIAKAISALPKPVDGKVGERGIQGIQGEKGAQGVTTTILKEVALNLDRYVTRKELEEILKELEKKLGILESNLHSRISHSNGSGGGYPVSLERLQIVTTLVDYTAKNREVVVCNAPLIVSLDAKAKVGDFVHIKRADGEVRVNGNIDGKTFKILNVPYYSMMLVFNGKEWSEI